jgi:dihydropyrimidinase
MNMLLKGGKLVLENDVIYGDLRIIDDRIYEIKENLEPLVDEAVLDVTGKLIMPGIIDGHVHYKMAIEKMYTIDNFETGSRSALAGGVTTVVDFADAIAGKYLVDSLQHRINEASRHSFVDHTFHMAIDGKTEVTLKDLKDVRKAGVNSLKVYTTYSMIMDYDKIFSLMLLAKEAGLIVSIHAEDNEILFNKKSELIQSGRVGVEYYGESRPVEAESYSIGKIVDFCEKNDVSVHIMHVSSGSAASIISDAKKRGVKISAETCPQYLMLNDRKYHGENKALYTISPPLRTEEERLELLDFYYKDTFNYVTTDHCAFSALQKEYSDKFFEISGGMPGTETLLPIMYNCSINMGGMSVVDLCKLLSTNTARKFGLYPQKGALNVGADADIVVFDPEKEVRLSNEKTFSAADYTPFDGFIVKGMPEITILRGEIVFENGSFPKGDAKGRFVSCC